MNQLWLLYTGITITYVVILIIYFLRRSKVHEKELTKFLDTAKKQLDDHKHQTSDEANQKVAKMLQVLKRVQDEVDNFEQKAQEEYEQIVTDAKTERRDIIASARTEIEELFQTAEKELRDYRQTRYQEIEENLIKLVMAVTEKVVEKSLSAKEHKDIILKALDEVKSDHQKK